MARFRAYASDSSDEEEANSEQEKYPDNVSDAPVAEDDEESDEEESSSSSSSDMLEDELTAPRKLPVSRNALVEDEEGEYGYAHDVYAKGSSMSPPPRNADRTIIPRAHVVGVDSQRMHVMQTSLFRMPEEAVAMQSMNSLPPPPPPRAGLLVPGQPLNRKHSRDSDGDGLRFESRERASFGDDIEPPSYRPSRKYARVETSESAVTGNEAALVDAGLAFGRSFRVGWGPGSTLVHLGSVAGPSSSPKPSSNSSTLYKTQPPIFAAEMETAATLSTKLLQHHLSYSTIETDDGGVPFANPSTHELHFASFASLFPTTDLSYEASLFRLGHALFDDIETHLSDSITVDIHNRISTLTRKAALSSWLESAVAPSVESDLQENPAARSEAVAFTLLTGNQIEKAAEVAMDGGNVKLATLISQAGGDFEFREDLKEQLQLWKEQRIDVHIDESVSKVYALLAGMVDEVVEGSKGSGLEKCSDVDILKGLDWKRVFGLHLWFSGSVDTSIAEVFRAYNELTKNAGPRVVANPIPWYEEQPQSTTSSRWKLPPIPSAPDGLFSLIRLHAEPACSLSHILTSLSFSASPVDYTIPWHLYIILSRCMRVRDFADRGDSGIRRDDDSSEEEVTLEGHSPSADLLCSTYAFQLEELGMLQEAMFVLLHIEGSAGREKAVKDLLSRSAPRLDEWVIRGIVGSLKIPMKWVKEAQAIYAVHNDELYDAYELYIAAGLYNQAHDLAVVDLAPDAVVRHDLELLKNLFVKFVGKSVDGWHVRGKVFMDYVDIMTRLPELLDERDSNAVPDAAQASEFEAHLRAVPKIIGLLPDIFTDRSDIRHKVALNEMTSGLVKLVDKIRPLALSQVQLPLVDEVSKLHIQSVAVGKFLQSVGLS